MIGMSLDDWDEDWDEEYMEEECDGLPCECYGYCDPSCPYWLGDGLCELGIETQAEASKEYHEKYVHENIECKVCGKKLRMYDLDEKEPFITSVDIWFIGLEVYGAYSVPKEILHKYRDDEGYRVIHLYFPGTGDEHLVRLLKDKSES